ncbi:hypothetical protein QAD02_008424 [Eretmocerus hayati]|uniref:Uncharacterized protein n=1 Tax=Eretmocerus hayati TaxID=131215 RepID=A0ACC2N8T8_9HYME|nr:hypothetical protein QAD02_008424 [Eretmocerus hayati]
MVKCLKCPNKGHLQRKIVYCSNHDGIKCLGAYHPSCSVRAGPREDGSYKTCCPEIEANSKQENHVDVFSSDLSYSSSSGDKFSDCEEFITDSSLVPEAVNSQTILKMSDDEDMSVNELWSKMKTLINSEAEKTNKNVDFKTNEISAKIDDALTRITCLEDNMSEALNRITVLENIQHSDKLDVQEQLYHEVHERLMREKNIIILGVPESEEVGFVENYLSDLLNDENIPFCAENYRQIRFGKMTAGKSRPVKIIFNSPDYAKWCLRNKEFFSKSGVKVVNDKTPEQLNYLRALGKQLDDMKKDGRKNLTIKYIKDIPKIIESKKPSQASAQITKNQVSMTKNSSLLPQQQDSRSVNDKNERSRSNSGSSSSNSQSSMRKQSNVKGSKN